MYNKYIKRSDMKNAEQPVIKVSNLTKKYGKTTALDSVSFEVYRGSIHGFLGPNGAGKTTAIKLMMDFINPTSGKVFINGQDAHKKSAELKKGIGYLSGDYELYDNLSGHQYLKYIAKLRGNKDYKHLMGLVKELEAQLDKRIGTLSRGNKQKIGLLAALMDDPDLLILDEPTTGLDPLMQQKFNKVIRGYACRGKTVFMSSHILSEVQEVCEVITFMKKGQIVETVKVSSLLSSAKRNVTLTYENNATILMPPSQLNISDVKKNKTQLSFNTDKSDRKLMRWIAMQPVRDVRIEESSLDSVFMKMYVDDRGGK